MRLRLCLCLAVAATTLPLTLSTPVVTSNSKEQPTDLQQIPTVSSPTETSQGLHNDKKINQNEALDKESVTDKLQTGYGSVRNQNAENTLIDDGIEEETTQISDYERALASMPGVVSTLHDPDTYNWILSYLPFKLPKLPKTFSLKNKHKDLLYGYLMSANKKIVGSESFRNAVSSADWLFRGYHDSQTRQYFKLALDALQDYYENRDGASLRDRLDRVLYDFGDEKFERKVQESVEWWTPVGTVLWGPLSQVWQGISWTSSENHSAEPATVRNTYKKWSDSLSEYMDGGQAWSSRTNTFIQETGRLLLPYINFATISDLTPDLVNCAACVANKAYLTVNLANIFFFLSALVAPLLLLALPIALAIWLAIVYGIKFKYIAGDHGGGGYGGGYGGDSGYGDDIGYSNWDLDESYRRSDDTSMLGNLANSIGSMMADSFINWGGVDSDGGIRKKVGTSADHRGRYSKEYSSGGYKRRGESLGGRRRYRPKSKYRLRSKPKAEMVRYEEYDDFGDYYIDEHVSL